MNKRLIYAEDAIEEIVKRLGIRDESYLTAQEKFVVQVLKDMPPAQPETAKRIVGKSRGGMTLWYQCDMCNEPVDVQDNFCCGCGRRLIDE